MAPDDVAAFVVEPVLGEGGYVVPPDGFLPALRELADRHGILLAVDEVQSGFARTGRFFATEWTDATPDIVIMAKGIASGLPLSGILAPRALLDQLAPGAHGGTYGGNAVACAAALATLDVIDDERLAERAERLGAELLAGLRERAAGHRSVAEVRGRGMMVAIEFTEPGTLAPRPDLAKGLLAEAMARNVLLLTCGTYGQAVRIIPPLVTTEDEVGLAVDAIGDRAGRDRCLTRSGGTECAQRVWVVDDEPLIRTAMLAVLGEMSYDSRGFGNAEELYPALVEEGTGPRSPGARPASAGRVRLDDPPLPARAAAVPGHPGPVRDRHRR